MARVAVTLVLRSSNAAYIGGSPLRPPSPSSYLLRLFLVFVCGDIMAVFRACLLLYFLVSAFQVAAVVRE